LLAFASGVELSGLGIENFAPAGLESGASVRYVLGQGFSTEKGRNLTFRNIKIYNKYRAMNDYASYNLYIHNVRHYGVHRGSMSRLDESIVFGATGGFPNTGSASAQLGDIYK
jgi:pectate lyase